VIASKNCVKEKKRDATRYVRKKPLVVNSQIPSENVESNINVRIDSRTGLTHLTDESSLRQINNTKGPKKTCFSAYKRMKRVPRNYPMKQFKGLSRAPKYLERTKIKTPGARIRYLSTDASSKYKSILVSQ
jgi:hypothetical protein